MSGRTSTLPEQKGELRPGVRPLLGRIGTEIHLRVEGLGNPVAVILALGQEHQDPHLTLP